MLRTDHGDGAGTREHGFKVGDRVRVGNGRTEWVIDGFGRGRLEGMAHLEAVAGFAATTVEIDRLRAVD